jgi:hypothetical protein
LLASAFNHLPKTYWNFSYLQRPRQPVWAMFQKALPNFNSSLESPQRAGSGDAFTFF